MVGYEVPSHPRNLLTRYLVLSLEAVSTKSHFGGTNHLKSNYLRSPAPRPRFLLEGEATVRCHSYGYSLLSPENCRSIWLIASSSEPTKAKSEKYMFFLKI